jgi:nucleoside-diphosphate-sugar epimerase
LVPQVTTDVTDEALQERVASAVADADPVMVEAGSDDAQEALEGAFAGVDAIVVAIGNREPWMPRTLALGMADIREAAVACKVPRLVVLSSFGLSGDPLPWKWIRYGWALMLATVSSGAWQDLVAMESLVLDNGGSLDVLIVRPTGLTPKLAAIGAWRLFRTPADPPIAYGIAKQDVAKFMVQEALVPTLHNAIVTIGGVPGAYADEILSH